MKISLDPNILNFSDKGLPYIQENIERIYYLNSESMEENIHPLILDESLCKLYELNWWPNSTGTIDEMLDKLSIDHLSSADILTTINSLSQRSSSLDDELHNAGKDYDEASIKEPEETNFIHTAEELKECLAKTVEKSAIIQAINGSINFIIGPSISPNKISRTITLCSIKSDGSIEENPIESEISFDFNLLSQQLYSDSFEKWKKSEDALELRESMDYALNERSLTTRLDFSFGDKFIDSLKRNQAHGQSKFSSNVFESVLAILHSDKIRHANPFYSNLNKRTQKSDGDYLAWRIHINKSHEALRLMFWRKGDEIVFANIGNKKELLIEAL